MRTRIPIAVVAWLSAGSALGMHESRSFIDADDVHGQGITGLGVSVAVIDTGIFCNHPGLAGSIAPGGLAIIHGIRIYDDAGEDVWGDGHGTHVSLIITDGWGVAPGASVWGFTCGFAGRRPCSRRPAPPPG